MAITERYCTSAGAGTHDGTSEANAWSFTEALANAVAGQRVNVKGNITGGSATVSPTNTGGVAAPIIFRGYKTAIGDLTYARDDDGKLVTADLPVITFTGASGRLDASTKAAIVWENLSFTSATTSSAGTVDSGANNVLRNCKVENTSTGAAVRAAASGGASLISCDLVSGSGNGLTVGSGTSFAHDLRVSGTAIASSTAAVCVFSSCALLGGTIGLEVTAINGMGCILLNCTFLNCTTAAIQTPNLLPTSLLKIVNCHATGCAKWLNSLYSATGQLACLVSHTRTRNNTTAQVGFNDWHAATNYDEVTTAGADSDDFVNPASGNYRLRQNAAAARKACPAFMDIGAYQRRDLIMGRR